MTTECRCEQIFTWEVIQASDCLFFKAPLLNQGVHKVAVSIRSFDSFNDCFYNAFWTSVVLFADNCIGVYRYHHPSCFLIKRRYTLVSTASLIAHLSDIRGAQLLTDFCHCSKKLRVLNTGYLKCLEHLLSHEYRHHTRLHTLLNEFMSIQSEYQTWYCAAVDFECSLDEVWTGCMAYTCREFKKISCIIESTSDYTLYSLDYGKASLNVNSPMCGFCRAPTRYLTDFCSECRIAICELQNP